MRSGFSLGASGASWLNLTMARSAGFTAEVLRRKHLKNVGRSVILKSNIYLGLVVVCLKIALIVILYLLAAFLLPFLFLFVCGLFVDTKKEYNRDSRFFRALLDGSTTIILWLLGVRYDIQGEEKFPSSGNFLFISNHRSNYDPIIQWTVFKKYRFSFISKSENFKVPIYGRLIHRCCFMPIDRKNPRKAMETINRAAKLLMETENSVGVYPEGKRSKECRLLPFHSGVLKAAQKSHRPIVVSTIEGTENIFRNIRHFRKTLVTIKILETIDADKVKSTKSTELSDYCAALMKKELEE